MKLRSGVVGLIEEEIVMSSICTKKCETITFLLKFIAAVCVSVLIVEVGMATGVIVI